MKDIKTRMVNGVIVSANGNISKEEILYAIEETKKEVNYPHLTPSAFEVEASIK